MQSGDMTSCTDHIISGDEEMTHKMLQVSDRHLYIHLQNSLNSTLKTGESASVKKIPQKKIFRLHIISQHAFSKNHSSKAT